MKGLKVTCLTLLLLGAVISHSTLAAKKTRVKRRFPHGCRDVGYEFKNQLLVLKPQSEEHPQTIYLIHNLSHGHLLLQLEKLPQHTFSPHYKNVVRPNQWGAFATDQSIMQFKCSKATRRSAGEQIDCGHVLELCQYTRAKFADNNMGNYWAVVSKTRRGAMNEAIAKGILLRW